MYLLGEYVLTSPGKERRRKEQGSEKMEGKKGFKEQRGKPRTPTQLHSYIIHTVYKIKIFLF